MLISEAQNKTASDLVDLVAGRVGSGARAVHPETAIASVARLAGSLLLRSFNLNIQDLEPGDILLSDQAKEEILELIGAMFAMLEHFGLSLDSVNLSGDQAKRGVEPQLSLAQSLSLLQEEAMGIARANGLDLKEAAQAAAIATAFIVKESARIIGLETSLNVAAYSFTEGCKTIPPLVGPKSKSGDHKPWYKLW